MVTLLSCVAMVVNTASSLFGSAACYVYRIMKFYLKLTLFLYVLRINWTGVRSVACVELYSGISLNYTITFHIYTTALACLELEMCFFVYIENIIL